MRILLTGGSGFLGTTLAKIAINKGHEVYSAYYRNLPRYGTPISMDITKADRVAEVFEAARPIVIIHTAALADVDLCEQDKQTAWMTNVVGTENIVESARRTKCFLIFVSSDYVFQGDKGQYVETDSVNPVNFYGITKVKGEAATASLSEDGCTIRSSTIFGSDIRPQKANFALWVLENLIKNRSINVITDQYVSPTLNSNLSNMILEIAETHISGIFHAAGSTKISRFDFAKVIAEVFCLDSDLINPTILNEMKWKAERPHNTSLNVEKASSILRNKPLSLAESMEILKKELEIKQE